MSKPIHVTPRADGKWQAKSEKAERAIAVKGTQAEAIQIAREQAIKRETEVVIHGKNGQIREKNSYGNDPFPPRG